MQTERWQQIEQLFHAALERVSHERVAYLRETSGGDLELQLEVESLLGAHEASGRLETAAPDLAEEWLNGRQPLVGQTLKHFQILAHLDSGGMGDVYLAEDNRVHRKVALKLGNSSREESCTVAQVITEIPARAREALVIFVSRWCPSPLPRSFYIV